MVNPELLLLTELMVPVLIGLIAYKTDSLDGTSSIAGIAIGSTIILTQNFNWFLTFLIFFISASAGTKYKYKEKKRIGLSQKRRKVENVLGNGLMAMVFALYGYFYASPLAIYGFFGAIATATADTLSSELGVLSEKKPVSVLDFKTPVRRGSNGGVSTPGNVSMIIGSFTIALIAIILFNNWPLFWLALWAGIFGCMIDSVLGALLENKGTIGNSTVNFLSTLAGGTMAFALSHALII